MLATLKQKGWMMTIAVALTLLAACGRNPSGKPAAEQLQKSFEKAGVPLKQEIGQAAAAFTTSNYTQAILIMDRVVRAQVVNEAQKQAMDALIVQTRRAVQQNPKLDSPQLYKAMSDLTLRLHGEN